MNEPPEIKDLPQLLQPYLDDSQVVSYTSRYLTKPGDNYGSLMISLTIKVKKPNGDIEDLPLIAKLPPITNDFFWKMFQPERTCLSENAAYKYLESEIRKLQLEEGVKEADLFDGFGKYYGSRASLDLNSEKVDRDAVLLMENLQTSGYKAGNRHRMFDLDEARLVITELAKLHAFSIALRFKRPEVYENKIYPYFQRFNIMANFVDEEKNVMMETAFQQIRKCTNNNENIIERVKVAMDQFMEDAVLFKHPEGPFVTITHCDLWINNVMFKYDESGKPIKLKFVDFQIAQVGHVAHDIIFVLFSSVDSRVLEHHFYEFLEMYYNEFIKCLERFAIPTGIYNYNNFLDEIRSYGRKTIWQALTMTQVILADKNHLPDDFKDMNSDMLEKNKGSDEVIQKVSDILRLADKFQLI